MFKEIINKLNLDENAKILVVHQDDVGVSHGSNLAFKELSSPLSTLSTASPALFHLRSSA